MAAGTLARADRALTRLSARDTVNASISFGGATRADRNHGSAWSRQEQPHCHAREKVGHCGTQNRCPRDRPYQPPVRRFAAGRSYPDGRDIGRIRMFLFARCRAVIPATDFARTFPYCSTHSNRQSSNISSSKQSASGRISYRGTVAGRHLCAGPGPGVRRHGSGDEGRHFGSRRHLCRQQGRSACFRQTRERSFARSQNGAQRVKSGSPRSS